MRKLLIVAALAVVTLSLGLIISYGLGSSRRGDIRTDSSRSDTPMNGIHANASYTIELEQVPRYPNIEAVTEVVTASNPVKYRMHYFTLDDSARVLAFYKMALPESGWTQLTDGPYYVAYEWRDTKQTLPWGLYFHILTSAREKQGTDVYLDEDRWPEVSRIPVYPKAHQIATETSKEGSGQYPMQMTTYTVKASLKDIESYYKSILAQHGWEFAESESRPITNRPGLEFRSLYRIGKRLSISAHQDTESTATIEVRFVQFELPSKL
jgi:hypothetical protein